MDIAYPLRFGVAGRTAQSVRADHVREMIEQLLLTSPGERVNQPDLGCGLGQMLFAPNSTDLAAALQFTLQAGLQRFLSDVIDIQLVEVTAEDELLAVQVTYLLRSTGEVSIAQVELSTETT